MLATSVDHITVDAATEDAAEAEFEFDDARDWLDQARARRLADPFAAEVWVLDESLNAVLLVRHRWRGWVCPGGKVEPGETPRRAAVRELSEETGINADLLAAPAAVFLRSYRSDWAPTLGLAYGLTVSRARQLGGESHQPVSWFPLEREWDGAFPEDRQRLLGYAASIRRQARSNSAATAAPRG